MNEIEFSALLCSRLCHDLISPVGAISNGLEIIGDEEDENMRREVMNMLSQSAEVTSSKLKFFRLSFGAAGGFGEKIPLREAQNAAVGLYSSGNINFSWKSDVGGMNKDAMKIMLNMVLLVGESLVRGGDLMVEITETAPQTDIVISATGSKIIFQDAIRETLLGKADMEKIEPKAAPAFLAANVAKAIGAKIDYSQQDEQNFSLKLSYKDI